MARNSLQYLTDSQAPEEELAWIQSLIPQAPAAAPAAPDEGLLQANPYPSAQEEAANEQVRLRYEAEQKQKAEEDEQKRLAGRTREQALLESLVRPTQHEGIKAGLFDGLFGGSKYTDDIRARRNAFDQALVGAQSADVSSRDRAAEAEASAQQFARQDETTRRGQDKSADERTKDRDVRERAIAANNERAFKLQQMRDAAAKERAEILKHGQGTGGGGAAGQDRAAAISGMEEAHLARAATMFGEKPVTVEQVRTFRANPDATPEQLGISPEQHEALRNENLVIKGMSAYDGDKYAQIIKSGSVREAGTVDQFGKTQELRWGDPKALLNIENELTTRNLVINQASDAWMNLSPPARQKLASLPPGEWQNAALSGKDQARVAAIQALANFDIKKAAGSAVTENEWRRVAKEIGLPDGVSIFNTPDSLSAWIGRHRKAYKALEGNALRNYKGLFGGGEQ